MPTWSESERELARWMEERFPDGGPADERLARADRRRFWSPQPVALAFLAIEVLADPADKRRLWNPAGPVHVWEVALWAAAALVAAAMATVAVRRRIRDGMWRSWVLDGLTRAQRRELEAEVRGRRPVVPGDEAALRHVARRWVAGALGVGWTAAVVLALLPAEITDPGSWTGVVKLAVLLALAGNAVVLVDRWRAGAAHLRTTAPARPAATAS